MTDTEALLALLRAHFDQGHMRPDMEDIADDIQRLLAPTERERALRETLGTLVGDLAARGQLSAHGAVALRLALAQPDAPDPDPVQPCGHRIDDPGHTLDNCLAVGIQRKGPDAPEGLEGGYDWQSDPDDRRGDDWIEPDAPEAAS